MDSLSFASKGVNINNGKADEVSTPIQICNDMIDLFPNEDFNNAKKIWADLYCKTGNTLIALKRYGVPKENIIAICTTPQSQLFACRQLYGKLLEETEIDSSKYPEVTGTFTITKRGNVYYISNWKNIVLGKVSNTNAFEIINKIILKETRSEMQLEWNSDKEFQINNIIMNPPYNKGMDLDFVNLAFKIATDNVVAITPAKWQTAEADQKIASKMSYGEFREQLVPHMSHVCYYPDAPDIFDIAQTDGITYFLIEKEKYDKTTIVNKCNRQPAFNSTAVREISNRQSLINIGNEIIEFINENKKNTFRFGDMSRQYKVYTASKVSKGASPHMFASDGRTQYLGISRIIDSSIENKPEQECNQSFSANTKEECESFVSYINTRFVRFLLICNVSKLNGIICDDSFRFVPAPPSGKFDHIYTDQELYKAFNLPQKYIDVIEAVIKERK